MQKIQIRVPSIIPVLSMESINQQDSNSDTRSHVEGESLASRTKDFGPLISAQPHQPPINFLSKFLKNKKIVEFIRFIQITRKKESDIAECSTTINKLNLDLDRTLFFFSFARMGKIITVRY